MQPEHIIEQIDEWLTENGWRLGESEIDFALDIRQLVAELDSQVEPALSNA